MISTNLTWCYCGLHCNSLEPCVPFSMPMPIRGLAFEITSQVYKIHRDSVAELQGNLGDGVVTRIGNRCDGSTATTQKA